MAENKKVLEMTSFEPPEYIVQPYGAKYHYAYGEEDCSDVKKLSKKTIKMMIDKIFRRTTRISGIISYNPHPGPLFAIKKLRKNELAEINLKVQASMRPGRLSYGGFLGMRERLDDVLKADDRAVKRLGVTHDQIADRIEYFIKAARYRRESPDEKGIIVDKKYLVGGVRYKCWQECPWGDDYSMGRYGDMNLDWIKKTMITRSENVSNYSLSTSYFDKTCHCVILSKGTGMAAIAESSNPPFTSTPNTKKEYSCIMKIQDNPQLAGKLEEYFNKNKMLVDVLDSDV
ncbi:hypothetical protein COS75_02200 [Candidatus Pacearchaeota archaeon CG06_land_8_20_14_3_00_35_12]|nr:MAG: hypothetical protein COS75_02200 [Candidatus Pacearchaeota archaeon CG06_land_8_20_14_3_00_35_12]